MHQLHTQGRWKIKPSTVLSGFLLSQACGDTMMVSWSSPSTLFYFTPIGHSLPQNNATQLRLLSHKPQGADKQAIHFEPKLPSSFLIPRLNIPQYLNLLPCGKRGGSCNSVLLNGGSQLFWKFFTVIHSKIYYLPNKPVRIPTHTYTQTPIFIMQPLPYYL